MTAGVKSDRDHGYARYRLDGCRCYRCAFARSEYDANRDRAIAYGTWQPYVDAEPVRVHIRTLQSCDMGLRVIATAAGVDRKRLQAVLNGRPERGTGPQERIRPELAAAVLAVEPTLDNLGGKTPIDGTGTRRRLQALVARGWPQHRLAVRLGMTDANFSTTLRSPRVIVRTARAVRAVYDELWNADPREHGVDNQAYSRARNHADSHGWAPVGAWDDDTIDDPNAVPDLGTITTKTEALAEDARWLIERQGYTREQVAARLGVTDGQLKWALYSTRSDQPTDPVQAPTEEPVLYGDLPISVPLDDVTAQEHAA